MQIIPDNTPDIGPDRPIEKRNTFQKDYLNRLDFSEQNDFLGGSRKRKGLKLALWTLAAATADHLIILAGTCVFLLVGTIGLQTSMKVFTSVQRLGMAAGYLYLALSITYFVLFRIFLGATLGEYSCSLRLGEPTQRLQKSYSVRILFRSLVIIGTGVVTLPLVSMLFKIDIAGRVSGVSIYSLK